MLTYSALRDVLCVLCSAALCSLLPPPPSPSTGHGPQGCRCGLWCAPGAWCHCWSRCHQRQQCIHRQRGSSSSGQPVCGADAAPGGRAPAAAAAVGVDLGRVLFAALCCVVHGVLQQEVWDTRAGCSKQSRSGVALSLFGLVFHSITQTFQDPHLAVEGLKSVGSVAGSITAVC